MLLFDHEPSVSMKMTITFHFPCLAAEQISSFVQYNYLNESMPQYDELPKRLMRSAFIGFCASVISDTTSNSIRVVKTTKQTSDKAVSYPEVVKVSDNRTIGFFCTFICCIYQRLSGCCSESI